MRGRDVAADLRDRDLADCHGVDHADTERRRQDEGDPQSTRIVRQPRPQSRAPGVSLSGRVEPESYQSSISR